MTIQVTEWHLEAILEGLEDSLKVATNAKTINEKGYAYACGYLESTMSNAIFELKQLLRNAK